MARLDVVVIPPKPVDTIVDYVLHLDQKEVEYLAKLLSCTDPRSNYIDVDDAIYNTLRCNLNGSYDVEMDELLYNLRSDDG